MTTLSYAMNAAAVALSTVEKIDDYLTHPPQGTATAPPTYGVTVDWSWGRGNGDGAAHAALKQRVTAMVERKMTEFLARAAADIREEAEIKCGVVKNLLGTEPSIVKWARS